MINKCSSDSTIRPAGGVNVLNSSHLVTPAASIISPRSCAREYKRRSGAQSRDGAAWGWSPASDSGLSSQVPAHWCSLFVCLDNSFFSVGKQDCVRGAAACRWLKSYFQFRRVHQRRKRQCTMKKPPLCRSPTMEVSRMCSHYILKEQNKTHG